MVQLKSDLVETFSKLRRKHELLVDRHGKLEYQQNRAIGKYHRRDLTDGIKQFIEYAKAQGSKGSHFLYKNISTWVNKACGIESIDTAYERQLAYVSSACDIVLSRIQVGMSQGDCYKQITCEIKEELRIFGLCIGGVNGQNKSVLV